MNVTIEHIHLVARLRNKAGEKWADAQPGSLQEMLWGRLDNYWFSRFQVLCDQFHAQLNNGGSHERRRGRITIHPSRIVGNSTAFNPHVSWAIVAKGVE